MGRGKTVALNVLHSKDAYVDFFNSPQFFFGLFGHSGLIIEHADRTCHLYSFHPRPNNGEPFGHGSIAQIANEEDAIDLSRLIEACLTPHEDDGRKDNRGIKLSNGTITWYERIRRIARMRITSDQAEAIETFALAAAATPHRFNILTYSCEHFVDDALAAGGVVLYSDHESLRHSLVPNWVYKRVSDHTKGIRGFQKIDFEQVA